MSLSGGAQMPDNDSKYQAAIVARYSDTQSALSSVQEVDSKMVHVACIMDGNGRWARKRGLPRTAGHTAGEESLSDVVRAASKREITHLTVFGFSTENWVRPRAEVRHILGLHKKLFGRIEELNENNVRVNWIGRPFDEPGSRTPVYVQRAIRKAIADTSTNTGMVMTVAFDYGSRAEITRSATNLIRDNQSVTTGNLSLNLYDSSLPPVDVLIRTSGESRISNFLLWQISGAEIYFTDRPWPDFDAVELDAALALIKN